MRLDSREYGNHVGSGSDVTLLNTKGAMNIANPVICTIMKNKIVFRLDFIFANNNLLIHISFVEKLFCKLRNFYLYLIKYNLFLCNNSFETKNNFLFAK